VIVRWGLDELPGVLDELSVRDPLLISTERWRDLDLPVARRFYGAQPHAEVTGVRAATEAAAGADGLVALGGGSAIDTAKAVSSETGLPIISIPTTYSGAEWTQGFGMRDKEAGIKRGGGGARTIAIVYEAPLTYGLPALDSAGSAMNALAHCAEALWAASADPVTDAIALDGARRLREHLTAAYASDDTNARGQVLVAACLAGMALGTVGTSLHHALCHLLGGMFDSPHAETHAIVLPYVIGYLQPAVPQAAHRLAQAMGTSEPALAKGIWSLGQSVGTPAGLRSIGIREDQLGAAAKAAVAKPLPSPRPLDYDGVHQVLQAAWAGQPPA